MISMFKKLFTKDRKPKFSKGDQVTNGSVTVFIIERVIDDGRSFYYEVNDGKGYKKVYHQSLLDMVWATHDVRGIE
tara:strand:+ start:749 stop:976 length:228 start_codon:yes stop_codon:yes gene_type:complete